jgi:CDGSH-type Zn-finger protein
MSDPEPKPFKIDPALPPKTRTDDAVALSRDEQGNPKAMWVCRCGRSKTWPMCDGTHKRPATPAQTGPTG